MTPQEYIDSGILEAYALGAASPAEQQEVERMAARHPEVKAALDAACESLESYATLHAVKPDPALREKILQNISAPKTGEAKVLPLQPDGSRWKMFAAAASVVMALSLGLNLYLFKKNNEAAEQNANWKAYVDSTLGASYLLAQENDSLSTQLGNAARALAFIRNPMTKSVVLNTTDTAHPMKAMVYWDTQNKMVAVDPMTLPQTQAGEKYVLWAMDGSTPVNYGSFSVSDTAGMMMLAAVPKADAFAISLEKDPGVTTPAGPVYVLGKP